jgi:hypothetical protein
MKDLPEDSESKSSDGERILEVVTCHGTIMHVTVEKSWKVTFGKLQESINHAYQAQQDGGNGLALRIYETKERQIACFRNIESFRDLGMKMEIVHSPKPKGDITNGGKSQPVEKHDPNVGSLVF